MGILDEIKSFFGEGNEIVESTGDALQERIKSPFYGYFLVSWFLFNWELVYSALFLDQEIIFKSTGLLRNEYVWYLFPKEGEYFLDLFIYPFIITLAFFWVFPYGTRFFFRKNLKNKKALRVIELQESQKEKKEEKDLVKKEIDLLREQVRKSKEQEKAKREAPEIVWEREYKDFKNNQFFKSFGQILDSIYKHNGKTHVTYYDGATKFEVETGMMVYADTNGLINILDNNDISLTDKGKFFMKKYSSENS